MILAIPDLEQRMLALDPSKSFIVQAPAGSGKTSLLVQRYLTLLATVNTPEEILAITFTRKAAHEMRDRIINALKQASENINIKNQADATTQKLALAAFKHNQAKKWNIQLNPHRLRIQTIDAFCNHLVRHIPILAKLNLDPTIIQNQEAQICYRKVARIILENLTEPSYRKYLETLLLHLDNDWQRAENLFITMIKSREQWLPHIVGLKNTKQLRQTMESALANVFQENSERCHVLFPQDLQQEFLELLAFSENNKENWHKIAELLLTKEFTWRKKVTKEHGFPTPTSGYTKQEKELFKLMKRRMEDLLIKFSNHENFRMSLENLLCSPPLYYNDHQWEMIEALLELLPLLAAQLKITFNELKLTDYAEISMAALEALGESELPSELALNLDYRLQHILVDEFQDTSMIQYRLLEKLITSWQPNDGHTLFAVGDPMQSIYRFREAEVGLFLRTQINGIGQLRLQPLTLTTNFRSTQNITNWINTNFSRIFPTSADISFGAVPFISSTAIKHEYNSQVTIELLANATPTIESTHVVNIIQKLQQQDPGGTIAILVRARSHVQEIVKTLQKNNILYQAHELESLAESIVIKDLFALTRALFHPADRIAWLAILRAPWCGLSLKDLHTIANGGSELIWDNICNYYKLNLSADGESLVGKFKTKLEPILIKCGRTLWRDLLEEAWLTLGGPATVTDEAELEHAKIYLELLNSNYLDIEVIQKKLQELYAPTIQIANIQIMTIHKAKGLEFDHVIIPGIDRTTRFEERKLMLWFERPQLHGGSSLLLAPIEASASNTDPVYQYLQLVEQKKNFYEIGRLLYVGITRAKKTAYMIGNNTQNIPKDSLLTQLQPCFNESWLVNTDANITNTKNKPIESLYRLSKDWITPIINQAPTTTINPTWQLTDNQAAIVGTAIHYCLCQIGKDGLNTWTDTYIKTQKSYWRKLLQQLGYTDIDSGLKLIAQAITLTLKDKYGRWILDDHIEAENELAITTKINDKIENFVIDRTFIEKDGIRWIIDYKTTALNSNASKYTQQLACYAKIMQKLDPNRQIKLGLYFPLLSKWLEYNCPKY